MGFKSIALAATMIILSTSANANIIVTWEDNAGDLVIRWNGDISNWSPSNQFSTETILLQGGNGMHALSGPVDLLHTGTAHDWYTGPSISNPAGVLVGDSFGTSGQSNWVYMPQDYAGQVISGSLTIASQGGLIGSFVAGSRDLGLGDNDNIVFQAATVVPVPAAAWLFGSGLIGLIGVARRKKA